MVETVTVKVDLDFIKRIRDKRPELKDISSAAIVTIALTNLFLEEKSKQ